MTRLKVIRGHLEFIPKSYVSTDHSLTGSLAISSQGPETFEDIKKKKSIEGRQLRGVLFLWHSLRGVGAITRLVFRSTVL